MTTIDGYDVAEDCTHPEWVGCAKFTKETAPTPTPDPAAVLARWREVEQAATSGEWVFATAPAEGSDETKAEYMARALTDVGPLYVLYVPATVGDPEGYIVPAVAGDGPNSRNNATFIATARTAFPALLAAVEAVLALHQPVPAERFGLVSWVSCSCGATSVRPGPDGLPALGPVAYDECPTRAAITTAIGGAR